MPSPNLGLAVGDQVWISRDAAGFGWFTDPADDRAFATGPVHGMDLLTTVMHEFGQAFGYDHDDGAGAMAEVLVPGTRRNPWVPDPLRVANGPGEIVPTSPSAGSLSRPPNGTVAAPGQSAARSGLILIAPRLSIDTAEKGPSPAQGPGARPILAILNRIIGEGPDGVHQMGPSPGAPTPVQWAALDGGSLADDTVPSPGVPLEWGPSPIRSKTSGKDGPRELFSPRSWVRTPVLDARRATLCLILMTDENLAQRSHMRIG
jgi:hypothetical protein